MKSFHTRVRAAILLAVALSLSSADAAQAPNPTLGQISGVAAAQDGGALPDALAQLRDLDTNEVIGTVATNADGQFVFVVTKPGNYVVEVVSAQGAVVATTAAIALTPSAMVVTSVAVTAPASAANSAASAAAAVAGGNSTANPNATSPDATASTNAGSAAANATSGGAIAGGSSGVFAPTAPYVSQAAGGAGAGAGSSTIPGTVPSRGSQSPSR